MFNRRSSRQSLNMKTKIISNIGKIYGIYNHSNRFSIVNVSNNTNSFTIAPFEVIKDVTQENISDIACTIEMEQENSSDTTSNLPFIFHSDRNDFFKVNENIMKRGQKRILLNNDVIASTENSCIYFTFYDSRKLIDTQFKTDLMKGYFVESLLGNGAGGYTYLVHNVQTLQKLALKKIMKSQSESKDDYAFEAKILNTLHHPNIVRLVHVHNEIDHTYLFTEYLNCKDLLCLIQAKENSLLEEQVAKKYFIQISEGLKYLHNRNIAHRDVKCDNIFVCKKNGKYICKIGDFGLSCYDNELTESCGTLYYSAPEMLRNKQIYKGTKCDIWSFGVVLFCMISGKFPFHESYKKYGSIKEQIFTGNLRFGKNRMWDKVSYECKHLMYCMMNTNPFLRYDIHEVQKHSWLRDFATNQIAKKRPMQLSLLNDDNSDNKIITTEPKRIKIS